jgi:hypothetical protein
MEEIRKGPERSVMRILLFYSARRESDLRTWEGSLITDQQAVRCTDKGRAYGFTYKMGESAPSQKAAGEFAETGLGLTQVVFGAAHSRFSPIFFNGLYGSQRSDQERRVNGRKGIGRDGLPYLFRGK